METDGNDGGLSMRDAARRVLDRIVAAGSESYERQRHLPRVIPVSGSELSDTTEAGRRRTVARLARALRAERMRGRAGHWTYDLNRHLALLQAYAAERRLLGDRSPVRGI